MHSWNVYVTPAQAYSCSCCSVSTLVSVCHVELAMLDLLAVSMHMTCLMLLMSGIR